MTRVKPLGRSDLRTTRNALTIGSEGNRMTLSDRATALPPYVQQLLYDQEVWDAARRAAMAVTCTGVLAVRAHARR